MFEVPKLVIFERLSSLLTFRESVILRSGLGGIPTESPSREELANFLERFAIVPEGEEG